MKLYEILSLNSFYPSIKDKKFPLKTAYKFNRLMRRVEEEIEFYNSELAKIIESYAKRENGQYVYSHDKASIEVIEGKEEECNIKMFELKMLDIDLSEYSFELEELEGLDLTVDEMNIIFPLIRN